MKHVFKITFYFERLRFEGCPDFLQFWDMNLQFCLTYTMSYKAMSNCIIHMSCTKKQVLPFYDFIAQKSQYRPYVFLLNKSREMFSKQIGNQ